MLAGEVGVADAGADQAGGGDAGTAVDNEAVRGQVLGEVVAGGNVHLQVRDAFAQKRRNLYPADVFGVRYMRAGLGNEYPAARFQGIYGLGPFHKHFKIALCSGKKYGERCKRARCRDGFIYSLEHLRVGDYKVREGGKAGHSCRE